MGCCCLENARFYTQAASRYYTLLPILHKALFLFRKKTIFKYFCPTVLSILVFPKINQPAVHRHIQV